MFNIFDLIFPRSCYSCGRKIAEGYLCEECSITLNNYLDKNICQVCGSPLYTNECKVCSHSDFYFDLARSTFLMNDVLRNLIHNFKYRDFPKIGKILAKYAAFYIKKNNLFSDVDFIIPVPLHRVKKRIRGFNQSEIIAKQIAKILGFNFAQNIIKRIKFTQTQTKLTKKERELNVTSAFKITKKHLIKNKNFMIIDDVFTTGSTVNSIAKILKENNADKVYVLTIIRAG